MSVTIRRLKRDLRTAERRRTEHLRQCRTPSERCSTCQERQKAVREARSRMVETVVGVETPLGAKDRSASWRGS